MALQDLHPDYSVMKPEWDQCRDSYVGERAIKDKKFTYLPATPGQVADGVTNSEAPGYKAYLNYLSRAVFPSDYTDAVTNFIGVMWSKPPTIKLPKSMEPMLEKATTLNEGLMELLRRINEQQLATGRCGLLLDLPENPDPAHPFPYIAMYYGEKIRNWDEGTLEEVASASLNLVVLDESRNERASDFSWKYKNVYRVLVLGPVGTNEQEGENAPYRVGVFKDNEDFNELSLITPNIRGKTLEEIPFVFINSKDNTATPDSPPLLPLSNMCLTIYRGEADYRQSLFMQGQDTLVLIGSSGEDDTIRAGAGAKIQVPLGGDAKFIGVSSTGLAEQRQALENDKQRAANKAGTLIDVKSGQKEAAATLEVRVAAQTASLNQIALSGAKALEKILKMAAEWIGANPDEVEVTPNLDFANLQMEGQNLVQLMTAKKLGAPLSQESIHQLMVSRNLTTKTYDEEQALLDNEEPLPGTGTGLPTDNPNDPLGGNGNGNQNGQ